MLRAVHACLRAGWAGMELDVGGALALARAEGVPGDVAAPLIAAAAEGVTLGAAERAKEKDG